MRPWAGLFLGGFLTPPSLRGEPADDATVIYDAGGIIGVMPVRRSADTTPDLFSRYALIPRGLRCCLGRRMALIRPKEEYRVFLFLHMFSDDWRRVIAGRVLNGATVDRIPLTSFPSFPILLPARKVAVAFGETVEPQFKLRVFVELSG